MTLLLLLALARHHPAWMFVDPVRHCACVRTEAAPLERRVGVITYTRSILLGDAAWPGGVGWCNPLLTWCAA